MGVDLEHAPVLFEEALAGLRVLPAGIYIDGTFGRGGHSRAMLQRLGDDGRLFAFDKDPSAVTVARQRFGDDPRFHVVQGSFVGMRDLMAQQGLLGKVNGILLDLGVSSPQLDDAERGFSFMKDGALDMRMDNRSGESAADWLAHAKVGEIARVLKDYGEERFAKRIANAIVKARGEAPIQTTMRLAEIVTSANPAWEKGKHPATRAFQAIRIFINRELEDLQRVLTQSMDLLTAGGRLVVISFHSLEDRIVKRFIRDEERGPKIPAGVPVTAEQQRGRCKRVGKAIYAGADELARNPRARSAVMRVAERMT